jgi:hypothetical protein
MSNLSPPILAPTIPAPPFGAPLFGDELLKPNADHRTDENCDQQYRLLDQSNYLGRHVGALSRTMDNTFLQPPFRALPWPMRGRPLLCFGRAGSLIGSESRAVSQAR